MIWNETKECMSRDEMLDLQGRRLVMLVKRMYYGTDYCTVSRRLPLLS